MSSFQSMFPHQRQQSEGSTETKEKNSCIDLLTQY